MNTTLQDRMRRVVRQDVQSMHGYAIQSSAGFVKLDTMKVHLKAGRNEIKLARTDGVESLLVHVGAFSGRVDFSLEGIAAQTFPESPRAPVR